MKEYSKITCMLKSKYELDNLHLIPYQQLELIPAINAYADLHFIFMLPQTEGHGFPSKVYTIMACARPLIVCSGPDTPEVQFLADINCAILIQERDAEKSTAALTKTLLALNADDLAEMGSNGFDKVKKHYSKEKVISAYIELADRLLEL